MSRVALGVDIGGTKIAVGAVDAAGAVEARRTIATDVEAGFGAGLARLERAIDETMAEAGVDPAALAGIGLGCPGPFDETSGQIQNFYTLPGWEGNDIVSPLAVMLTIGTGIGGAALIDGAILRGARGEHPEIGHLIVDPAGPACYCGSRGCIEAFAAGPALARAGAEFGYADAEAVFAAAEAGEEPAKAIVARSAEAMGTGVWSLIHAFLPEAILIGGGMGERHFALYRDAAERAIARAVLAPAGAIRVVKAALGNDAGMVGAAALMLGDA